MFATNDKQECREHQDTIGSILFSISYQIPESCCIATKVPRWVERLMAALMVKHLIDTIPEQTR
jgi:hypothetical protein